MARENVLQIEVLSIVKLMIFFQADFKNLCIYNQIFSGTLQVDFKFYVEMHPLSINGKFYFFQCHLLFMHPCLNLLFLIFKMILNRVLLYLPVLKLTSKSITLNRCLKKFFFFKSELRELFCGHSFPYLYMYKCIITFSKVFPISLQIIYDLSFLSYCCN